MATPSQIAKKHYEAALAEAAAASIPADTMARTLMSFLMVTYREHYSIEQIREELTNLADNLDPDEEYLFMRP